MSFKSTSLILSFILLIGATSAFVAGDYYDIEVDGPKLVPGEVNCEEEFEEGFVGGIGTAESPYEIDSVEKLQCIAWNNNSAHYELVEDIDASETETWDEGRGFKSISQASRNTFKGVLDGRNHTINNLYINRTESNTGSAHRAVGLLGNIKDSKIKNIKIENAFVRGDSSVGSLVGQAVSSEISNIKSNGKIKSLTDAGGVVGELKASNISGTSFSGKVQGEKIGGITADSSGINGIVEKENSKEYRRIRESSINNSKSNATLKGESIGGIARINHGLITNSLFNGQIHLRGNQAGGISVNGGKIKNSYSKAEFTIYAGLSEPEIGGITGNSNSYTRTIGAPTEINNSISTSEFKFKGRVEPSDKQKIGAIAGKTNSIETNNVYREENSANIREKSNGDIEKLSTEEIKNSLTAIDLGKNWATAKNEYPQLKPFAKGNLTTYEEQKTQESNSKTENNKGIKDLGKPENFNKSTNYTDSEFRSNNGSNSSNEKPRDILKENLTLVQNNSVETKDTDQPYMAGLFHLQLDIPNSSSEEVQLENFKLKEYKQMEVGTIRATGSPGKTHSIELISKDGTVIEDRDFKLYETTHNDVMTADGTYASSDTEKNYYEEHIFNFEADYSARKIKVYEGEKQIFNLNIPEKLCNEQSKPKYCEYNNISTKEDIGENKSSNQLNTIAQEQSLRDIVEFVFSLF